MSPFRTVICGGGVAALEGALRLRRLAGDAVDISLVAPNEHLAYRPQSVGEPFGLAAARRWALEPLAAEAGAQLVRDRLRHVDRGNRQIGTHDGRSLEYDALLIAVGAHETAPFPGVTVFDDARTSETFASVVEDLDAGALRSLALILPEGSAWPLPVYELALMTARRARQANVHEPEISLVTPEPRPLAAFGDAASEALERLLDEAHITLYRSAIAHVPEPPTLLIQPQGIELHPDRIVAMPHLTGPSTPGIAGTGAHGFIPIDSGCRVPGDDARVFAAGDAAGFPVKHGGLAAQQADVAAAGIASLSGADVDPYRLVPVIRGILLTGADPLYLTAEVVGARGFHSEVSSAPLWSPGEQLVAEELGPVLARLDPLGA
jgi:sulfide:quinone oxidoreductase